MGNIYFVGGEVGGVGKSMISQILAHVFEALDKNFLVVDADVTKQSIHYSDLRSNSGQIFFSESDEGLTAADPLIGMIKNRDCIVDLPPNTQVAWESWIDPSGILEDEDYSHRFYFLSVLRPEITGIKLFQRFVNKYPNLKHIAVQNSSCENHPQMWQIYHSHLSEITIDTAIKTIECPYLQLLNVDRMKMDIERLSFADAITNELLSSASRENLKNFLIEMQCKFVDII